MKNYMFGKNIKYLRKKNGMTQQEFGALFGKSSDAVSAWERGLRIPIVEETMKVAEHFNVLVVDLVEKDLSASEPLRTFTDYFDTLSRDSQLNLIKIVMVFDKLSKEQQSLICKMVDEFAKE